MTEHHGIQGKRIVNSRFEYTALRAICHPLSVDGYQIKHKLPNSSPHQRGTLCIPIFSWDHPEMRTFQLSSFLEYVNPVSREYLIQMASSSHTSFVRTRCVFLLKESKFLVQFGLEQQLCTGCPHHTHDTRFMLTENGHGRLIQIFPPHLQQPAMDFVFPILLLSGGVP